MFSFLNSTILFAAAAALIPLIIHLFSKRRLKIIEFSSIKHLKQMQRRQVRRLKIKQLLLLLLRMLIILVAVLAFARPTTESGSIGSHASVSAVILFDNSASMNRYVSDGNLFEISKKRCEELLNTFGEGDEICLIPLVFFSENETKPKFASAAATLESLNLIKAGYKIGDLQSGYEYGLNLLDNAQNLNKEIYIISDRQKNLLPPEKVVLSNKYRNYLIDLPTGERNNIAITSVNFGGQLIIPGHDFEINVAIKNFGTENRNDLMASLFIDGNRISQTSFDVKSGNETVLSFTKAVSRTGFHEGYIEISDDLLMFDNKYYFSFQIPEQFNLLIVNGDASGSFLSLALSPENSLNQYWSIKEVTLDNLTGVNFYDYEVIFLCGSPSLSTTYLKRLEGFLISGGSLFINYGTSTDIDYFNKNLSKFSSVVYDEPLKTEFSRAGYYSIQTLDNNHPVFSVYDFENNSPPQIKFYTLPKLHLLPNGKALMSFTGNHPALVESSFGKGKVLTFTGPILPEYTDITTHAFFVPFVSRVAEYLASDLSGYDFDLRPGKNINRSLSLKGSVNTAIDMFTPDSVNYKLPLEETQGTGLLHVQPVEVPGIYNIKYMGREIDRFAVNTDPAESDLTEVDYEQLTLALNMERYDLVNQGNDIAAALTELRYGKELWQIFLWLVVVLIIIEIFISRSSEKEPS